MPPSGTSSEAEGLSVASHDNYVHMIYEEGRPPVDFDKPMGMMIAIPKPDRGGGFKVGKVTMKYKGPVNGGEDLEVGDKFHVLFKDTCVGEYSTDEILAHRMRYIENEGNEDCHNFSVVI